MSVTYTGEIVSTKKYTPNVVICIDGTNYFAIRQPDSGLSISSPFDKSVGSLILNPTTIDIRRVTTTISNFSFRLIDKGGIVSALVVGDAANLIGQAVRIFLGRSNVGMAFADYFELPITYISKIDHTDNSYNFSTQEQTARMDRQIYPFASALAVDILSGTTIWTMRDDLSKFPSAGMVKVDDEFASYTSVDVAGGHLNGVVRGELGSTPATHGANTECVVCETVTDNPLNIILKILISGGGTGTYDTLQSGLGIDQSLVDIAGIEALRDELFFGAQYTLTIYSVASALTYIETELLAPNNLRFSTSRLTSKISLVVLNKARFVEQDDVIDDDTVTKFPQWSLDGSKVTNQIVVNWDFNEGTNQFQKQSTYTDADSVTLYGALSPLTFDCRGIKSALNGQALVDDFGQSLLARLSSPTPTIAINTQMDKSLQTIGDRAYLVSNKVPASDGTLAFASDLEIVSRAINQTTGDVQFGLAFTSYTNIRSAFISPSDTITHVNSQSSVNVATGRGAMYIAGWVMRLWDDVAQVYLSDAPNPILSISGDTIVFQNAWSTTLTTAYKIRFADYDDVVDTQKRYAFISAGGADFSDSKPTYKVTY